MLDYILCGMIISCHLNNLKYNIGRPKYPPDVVELCQYFESQKTELPDYCKWEDKPKPPRRRSEL
jgi:hypothetical protein